MSQAISAARSNSFAVKDVDALTAELQTYGVTPVGWDKRGFGDLVLDVDPEDGSVTLFIDGAWPTLDEEMVAARLDIEDDETPVPTAHEDIMSLVASHLVEGEVAMFVEVGFEKLRELFGTSVAVNAAGEKRILRLDDMYEIGQSLTTSEGAKKLTSF